MTFIIKEQIYLFVKGTNKNSEFKKTNMGKI